MYKGECSVGIYKSTYIILQCVHITYNSSFIWLIHSDNDHQNANDSCLPLCLELYTLIQSYFYENDKCASFTANQGCRKILMFC